jgi:hypothetical protein
LHYLHRSCTPFGYFSRSQIKTQNYLKRSCGVAPIGMGSQ